MDLQEWKDGAKKAFANVAAIARQLRDEGLPHAVYAALATTTLAPITAAVANNNLAEAVLALVGVAGNVGANLIANLVQNWKDKPAHEQAKVLAEELNKLPDLHSHLDKIIQHIDAITEAQAVLQLEDRRWFAETLQAELDKLGSSLTISDSVLAVGPGAKVISAPGGMAAEQIHVTIETPLPTKPDTAEDNARKNYLRALSTSCNLLPLSALAEDRDPHRESLMTLSQVYIELDTTERVPLSKAEQQERKKRSGSEEKERPLTALEAAVTNAMLVLLGDPGSGKSSFTNHLLYLCAGHLLNRNNPLPANWPQNKIMPVRIFLRELAVDLKNAGAQTWLKLADAACDRKLVTAIEQHVEKQLQEMKASAFGNALHAALAAGDCLVVLDGLDEVPFAERELMRRAIIALRNLNGPNHYLVTCRVRSWDTKQTLPAFYVSTLSPFTKNQVDQFIRAWYGALRTAGRFSEAQAADRIRSMKDAIGKLEEDLVQNPLLLTTMAVVHYNDADLPRERVKLYKRAAEVLLKRWQLHRAGRAGLLEELGISDRELYPALWELAYTAHATGKEKQAADIPREQAIKILERHFAGLPEPLHKPANFLDYVDQSAGILVGRGGAGATIYAFPHRTFQEYFAGTYLAKSLEGFDAELKKKIVEGDYWQVAAQLGLEHILHNDQSRRDALLAAYELCPDTAPEDIDAAAWRGILWSANFALEIGTVQIRSDRRAHGGQKYLGRLIANLVKLIEGGHLSPLERAEAGRALSALGDHRPGVCDFDDAMWVALPGGEFMMGDDKGDEQWGERPAHRVKLSPFNISRYPITNAQFAKFIEAGGYQDDRWWSDDGRKYRDRDKWTAPRYWEDKKWNLANHPVVGVSWFEAEAFCKWLAKQVASMQGASGKEILVRLPTEAEWEFAARGGNGKGKYPWGDDDPTPGRANYNETRLERTSAVGSFPDGKTPNDIFDLAGNVWEWCHDWYGDKYYAECKNRGAVEDPQGPASGDRRVLRGGSWDLNQYVLRAASRLHSYPDSHWNLYGFRVVVSSEP